MNDERIKRTILFFMTLILVCPVGYGHLMKKANDADAWMNDAIQAGTCIAAPTAVLDAHSQNSTLSFSDEILKKCVGEQASKPQGEIRPEGEPLPGYSHEDDMKDRFILALMSPYIQNAMTEYFGVSKAYMNERILSIEKIGGKYKLRIYLETFTGAHNPPYGKDIVTLALDYSGVETAGYEHEEDPPWSIYENREYRVLMKYPPEWRKDARETLSDRYEGADGFFMIDAMSGGDYLTARPIDEVVGYSAYHKLMPYGSDPQITALKVDNQDARLISPSSDQPGAPPCQSELIVKYPGPVEINGSFYHYFILYADSDHIKDIAKTIRFTYLTDSPTANSTANNFHSHNSLSQTASHNSPSHYVTAPSRREPM